MAEIIPSSEINTAKAWLHDVFVWGGLASTPKRAIPAQKYRYMYGTDPDNFRRENKKYYEAAVTICNTIKNREVETKRFQAFDDAIKTISQCHFNPDINSNNVKGGSVKKEPEELCKYIAWFCDQNHWVFDNKNTSVYEMHQIINTTLLGKILWDDYLYYRGHTPENRPATPATPAEDPAPAVNTTPTAAPQASGQPNPGNHKLFRYNCNGLADPTGTKLTKITTDGLVYWIGGEFSNSSGKTKPKLHVSPLTKRTPNQNPLTVKYTTGQGEDDCILFFASEGSAKNFLGLANANKPSSVAFLEVKKVKEDPNGYVEVITDLGNAYIKAYKLREEVEEEVIKENKEQPKATNKEIWEAFKEGFFRD